MATLYVDCDDTLVRWLSEYDQPLDGQNPYGGGSQRWRPNVELVEAVLAWLAEDPRRTCVVWSGGGYEYARSWLGRIFNDAGELFLRMSASSKHLAYPQAGDVCVDDQPIKVQAVCVTAEEFVAGATR